MGYNWHWRVLFETEPGGTGTYLHYLIVGLGWTLVTALAAWVIALLVGSVVGTLRTTPLKWAVRLGNFYVEIFRNVPMSEPSARAMTQAASAVASVQPRPTIR